MINYSYTEISDQLAADYCNMNNSFILKPSPDHSSATVISGESHLQQQQQHHQNELDTVVTAAQLQQLKQGTSNKPLPTEQEQKNTILTQQHASPSQQHHSFMEPLSQSSLVKNTPIKSELKRKNKPGKKFGAKKRSWVWTWFDQDLHDTNITKCTYCNKVIIRFASDKGSPKKLLEHLKTHKININSINFARPVPIDGTGMTYSSSGQPLSQPLHNGIKKEPGSNQTHTSQLSDLSLQLASSRDTDNKESLNGTSGPGQLFNSSRFRINVVKFLTENKLSMDVLKSNSFRQLVYDLRPESVNDILEVTSMYDAFLECTRYSPAEPGNTDSNLRVNGSNT